MVYIFLFRPILIHIAFFILLQDRNEIRLHVLHVADHVSLNKIRIKVNTPYRLFPGLTRSLEILDLLLLQETEKKMSDSGLNFVSFTHKNWGYSNIIVLCSLQYRRLIRDCKFAL